ncbi:MAG TPA: ATP-binding protein [Leadbetterella sp.]|nr:ATP-binding protein [Leadbetterella sp.]
MKTLGYLLLFILFMNVISTHGQNNSEKSTLEQQLSEKMPDSTKVLLFEQIAKNFWNNDLEKALKYANEGLELANKINFEKGKNRCLNRIGGIYGRMGNHQKALMTLFEAIKLSKQINDLEGLTRAQINLGVVYGEQKQYHKAIECYKEASRISGELKNEELNQVALMNIGAEYVQLKRYDSAYFYTEKSYLLAKKLKSEDNGILLYNLGNIRFKNGEYSKALKYFRESSNQSKKSNNDRILSMGQYMVAKTFQKTNDLDSSLIYAKAANTLSEKSKNLEILAESGFLLSELYEKTRPEISLQYFKKATAAKDSLFNFKKNQEIQQLIFNEKILSQELEFSKKELKNKQIIAIIISLLAILAMVVLNLYVLNKNKSKANRELSDQKNLIEKQKLEIEASFEKLKNTQKQLILQEKLASLGELTAGIAHEIQNPLNFVTNFSELSIELSAELKALLQNNLSKNKNDIDDLIESLSTNLSKIQNHGNRASSIVKNMLEHSRGQKSEMTLANINQLSEEYLRLSYHGMRAKYTGFNSEFETKLDENLPEIKIYNGDIGRVLLNLFNNAFYAVNSRAKTENKKEFHPKVILQTEKQNIEGKEFVKITVEDNGTGIKDEIKDKIFQPFFTTKPTGQGTGLGLSLSRDIIINGHSGTLDIESEEGKGTKFIIQLPVIQ